MCRMVLDILKICANYAYLRAVVDYLIF